MFRRLCVTLLLVACALAPAWPAVEVARTAASCCCGNGCCDPMNANAACPVPVQARTVSPAPTLAIELREIASRPAPQAARLLYVFVSPVLTATTRCAQLAPAVRVPLFKEHCSFRI